MKPDGIPDDIWEAAKGVFALIVNDEGNGDDREHIARALLAERLKERELCAIAADEIGKAYGEDETGWLDCSETIAKSIRSRP